jgi:hypothetical protein
MLYFNENYLLIDLENYNILILFINIFIKLYNFFLIFYNIY